MYLLAKIMVVGNYMPCCNYARFFPDCLTNNSGMSLAWGATRPAVRLEGGCARMGDVMLIPPKVAIHLGPTFSLGFYVPLQWTQRY